MPPIQDPNTKGGGSVGGTRGGQTGGGISIDPGPKVPQNPRTKIERNPKGSYGTVHNGNNGQTRQPPITIRSLPGNGASLPSQVLREENVRRRHDIRSGYYHWDPYWRDDFFWCGWYVFDPFRSHCVISPWYWYSSLPGYLNYNCIRIINIPVYTWHGSWYNYRRPVYYGGGYESNYRRTELDYAIDDMVLAFEEQDRRSLSRLIPRSGRVHMYINGRYDYSLEADDYYNLMLDGIYNSQTRRYEIVKVETYRGQAEVVARHEFSDAWGRRNSVYHWYRLEEDRRGYVITSFGTSDFNCW